MQIASATGRVYVIVTDYLWDGIQKLLHFSTVSTKWAPWNSVILQCKSRLASCALTWQAIRATASGWFNFNPRASRFWARNPVWWIRSPSSSRGLSLMTKNSWLRAPTRPNQPNKRADLIRTRKQQTGIAYTTGHPNLRHRLPILGNSSLWPCIIFVRHSGEKARANVRKRENYLNHDLIVCSISYSSTLRLK